MHDLHTDTLSQALYQAVEHFWAMARDAWESHDDTLKRAFVQRAAANQEPRRAVAFGAAFAQAQGRLLAGADPRLDGERVLVALDRVGDSLAPLAQEGAKLMLFAAFPDERRLVGLCRQVLPPVAEGGGLLESELVAVVLAGLLCALRDALLNQEAYADLVRYEVRYMLVESLYALRPTEVDDDLEATYRDQLFALRCRLDFSGLLEWVPLLGPKPRLTHVPDTYLEPPRVPEWVGARALPYVTVDDLFVAPQLERGSRMLAVSEMLLAMQSGNEAIHPREMQRQEAQASWGIDLDQALRQSRYLVVLGESGMGKTMLLSFLTSVCARQQWDRLPGLVGDDAAPSLSLLPLFVSLQDYAAESQRRNLDYSLIHHLYAEANARLFLFPDYGFFEQALEDGRCVVCLDGLNDVRDRQQRKFLCDTIRLMVARFPHNRYLVTSRTTGYQDMPLDHSLFDHYTLLPICPDGPTFFDPLTSWYSLRTRDVVDREAWSSRLLACLLKSPYLRTLASNRLHLTLIAMCYQGERVLDWSKSGVYDAGVSAMIALWKASNNADDPLCVVGEYRHPFFRLLRRLLERMAYELQSRSEGPEHRNTMDMEEIVVLFGRFLKDYLDTSLPLVRIYSTIRHFMQEARGAYGVLVERQGGGLAFSHRLFQEYLAACDIEHRCVPHGVEVFWGEIAPRLHDPHWREVIFMLFENLSRYDMLPTLLLQRLLQAGEQDRFEPVLHRHLYLAARVLTCEVVVALEVRHEIVDRLLAIASRATFSGQQDALRALSWLNDDPFVLQGLQRLVSNPHLGAMVRVDAARIVGPAGRTDEVVHALLSLAYDAHESLWNVRAAAMALGDMGHVQEAVEVLLTLARDPQASIRERCSAAEALGGLGHAEEAAEVLLALAHDPASNAGMRRQAAEALGNLGRAEVAITILLSLCADQEMNAWQRRYAAEALGNLGHTEIAAEVLLTLVRDQQQESSVRRFAMEALGKLGVSDGTVSGVLIERVQDPLSDPWERSTAAIALGKLGHTDRAIQVLLEIINDPHVQSRVRRTAAVALGTLGHTDDAARVLLMLARDPQGDPWERSTTAVALGSFGCTHVDVLDGLLILARNPLLGEDERSMAAVALGMLGRADDAADVLLMLARSGEASDWVRRIAYDMLKRLLGSACE